MSCNTPVPIATRVLQEALSELHATGEVGGNVPITGRWDSRTMSALIAFGASYGARNIPAMGECPDVYLQLINDDTPTGSPLVMVPSPAVATLAILASAYRRRLTMSPPHGASVPATSSTTQNAPIPMDDGTFVTVTKTVSMAAVALGIATLALTGYGIYRFTGRKRGRRRR